MTGFRIAAGAMCALFLLSAGLQWNDPDPWLWIALYGVAGGLAGAAAWGRVPLLPNAVALAGFALLTVAGLPSLGDARSEAFTSFAMVDPGDEEPRETAGLAICTAWTALQTTVAWRRRNGGGG